MVQEICNDNHTLKNILLPGVLHRHELSSLCLFEGEKGVCHGLAAVKRCHRQCPNPEGVHIEYGSAQLSVHKLVKAKPYGTVELS